MMKLFNYLLHHDEGIDPTLAEWIHNVIDDFFQVDSFVLISIGIIGKFGHFHKFEVFSCKSV